MGFYKTSSLVVDITKFVVVRILWLNLINNYLLMEYLCIHSGIKNHIIFK